MRKCLVCGKTNSLNFRRFKTAKYCSMRCRNIGMLGEGNQFYGKHHNAGDKKVMSELKKGTPLSIEHRKKQSISHKANPQVHWIGRKHKESTKILMSQKGKGRVKTEEHKRKIGLAHIGKHVKLSTRRKIALKAKVPMIGTNTLPERIMKKYLIISNLEEGKDFHQNYKMSNIKLPYNVDFIFPSIKTIVECDGEYWHASDNAYNIIKTGELSSKQKKQVIKDQIRVKELREKGYVVLRFGENQIKKRFEEVSKELYIFIKILKGEYNVSRI